MELFRTVVKFAGGLGSDVKFANSAVSSSLHHLMDGRYLVVMFVWTSGFLVSGIFFFSF